MYNHPDSTTFSAADHAYMAQALELAEKGLFTATPNPRVGCVLVKNRTVIARGWHERAGEAHAEVHALEEGGEKARGATAYVTLEPCAHFGRTPPCADALIAAGISRVVVAMQDPNPAVAGRGLEKLRAAGIAVSCGLFAEEAQELNIGFIARMTRNRPWVRLKAAATLDGKTALENGVSQWISGDAARADGHRWRARACAILTGIGTVKADDPELSVREYYCERQPLRIVLDPELEIPPSARILQSAPVLIVTAEVHDSERAARLAAAGHRILALPAVNGRIALNALMLELAKLELNEVHVEAGNTLNGALFAAGLVDELLLYLAPLIVGNAGRGIFDLPALTSLAGAARLAIRECVRVGDDLRVLARPVQ